ncbi:MAG: hypothetical protein PUD47_02110, partial [Bacteroidales bacterium]|nr:hypothetical protein [Bacteroidales bacterium]
MLENAKNQCGKSICEHKIEYRMYIYRADGRKNLPLPFAACKETRIFVVKSNHPPLKHHDYGQEIPRPQSRPHLQESLRRAQGAPH